MSKPYPISVRTRGMPAQNVVKSDNYRAEGEMYKPVDKCADIPHFAQLYEKSRPGLRLKNMR